MRMSPRRCRISCSSFRPSAPLSLKPAEITTAPLTSAVAHSPIRPGTVAAGVATIARSKEMARRQSWGTRLLLNTFSFRVDRVDTSVKREEVMHYPAPSAVRFFMAPITATHFGLSIVSSLERRWSSGRRADLPSETTACPLKKDLRLIVRKRLTQNCQKLTRALP